MLIPLFLVLLLTVLINRTAKKFNTSSTVPLSISISVFILFVLATRGAIRVRQDNIALGILLGLLMYLAVAAAIYAGAYMWMKKKVTIAEGLR